MEHYQDETYGERIADIYDELYADWDPTAIVALSQLANGGRALELGIGTGRIALPLQQTGIEVHGIDASEAMIARLRKKPGGQRIPVASGNFADVAVEGRFNLIYVLFNTFYALLTQDEQLRCMRGVSQHLTPQGVFVVEAFVPDLTRFTGRQSVRAVKIGVSGVQIDVSQHDPVTQQVVSQHLVFTEQGMRLFPVKLRYVWPSEFDLMARLAGMRLKHRWGDWQGGAFIAESGKHISVFELAPTTNDE
jgi:SAM-dependent methyltransferase